MADCNFLFDVIVTHFEAPIVKDQDTKRLEVEVQFNSQNVPITASRINVSDFKPGISTALTVVPMKLRQNLEQCGMPLTVKYKGQLLGTGQIAFPEAIIDSIDEGMTDLIYTDTCKFEKNGELQGTVDLLCRLIIKCDDQPKPGESACRRNMDRSINPRDIMFVMGESQRCPSPCDPCLDTWEPEEGDVHLKLDLQRYHSFNTDELRPAETLIHNPVGDAITCELKKMAQECEQVIDTVTKYSMQSQSLKPPCRGAEALRSPCGGPCQYHEHEQLPVATSLSKFSLLPARTTENVQICSPTHNPMTATNNQLQQIKPIRHCPICLASMSWLPKFAACPKCGAKPKLFYEERPEEKPLTADQILLQYLGKPKETIDDYCVDPCKKASEEKPGKDKLTGCTCTCKYDKLCAYCRVRKLLVDIYKTDEKPVSKDSKIGEDEPDSSEDFCVMKKKSVESRPFLARVFSELRDLYDIKDTKKPEELNKICDRPSQRKNSLLKPIIVPKGKKKAPTQNEERSKLTKQRIESNKLVKHKRQIGLGHELCAIKRGAVSRRHGWNWSSTQEARKYGWRPGAILKPMSRVMNFFLQYSPDDSPVNICKKKLEAEKEIERQLPVLNMCKKNGEIIITLRAPNNPHVEMKPITFKVVKSDLAMAVREIKKKLKEKGFRKCTCHQTLMLCTCRENIEKKQLEDAVQDESLRYGIESCVDHLVLTDTSDSEMEFDFDVTPPMGVAKPLCALKPRTVNHSTQTVKKDRKVPPTYPVKLSPYWRTFDCAAGDRYTGTAFGGLCEDVFEDGVFGFRGGGPHGARTTLPGKFKSKGIWGKSSGGPMRGGGRIAPGGIFGEKNFPGGKKKPKGSGEPIPVRMPKRFYKAAEAAAKAAKAAKETGAQKKAPDMMKYMMQKGAVPTPWNPNANA